MRSVPVVRTVLSGAAVLTVLVALTAPGRADVVIFKDGYTLVGKVDRDAKKQVAEGFVFKVGGFWLVDDGARRIVFSHRHVQDVDEKEVNKGPDLITFRQPLTPFITAPAMEPMGPLLDITPFNNEWYRNLRYQPLRGGPLETKQRLTLLTPQVACVEASRLRWQSWYQTRELGAETLRQLLLSHPDTHERRGEVDPIKRTRIARFLVQGGFCDFAERELDQWLADAPKDKETIDGLRKPLVSQRAQEMLDALVRAHRAGQHVQAQKLLTTYPKDAEERHLKEVRALRASYETAEVFLKDARRFLKDLPTAVSPEAQQAIFTEAAAAILAELNIDNYSRLERFVTLARQAERDKKEKRPVTDTPGDLMGLAVSGWVLGNSSAEAKAESGLRLWRGRKFVRDYQRTDNLLLRQKNLADFEKDRTNALGFDEMTLLIGLLPPPEPEEKLAAEPLPLDTKLPPAAPGKPTPYIVQLPPEYHPGRQYPLLMVLSQSTEKPADAMTRWLEPAQQNGYILVAPQWNATGRPGYNYSGEEHGAVLEVLRDVQRRFNVDADRVFLFGAGQGGDMALDFGLAHPDLFAGVLSMGGQPRYHAKAYAANAQFLPCYLILGELASDGPKNVREQLKTWIGRGTPVLYVEYKGRGQEWFTTEFSAVFDWMGRKKRASAVPEVTECVSMRPGDNRFYWLSGEGIKDRSVNNIAKWNPLLAPATLQGRVADSNQIHVHSKNWSKVTLWFTLDNMIDFMKPVTILVNTVTRWNSKKISTSVTTLLEDFYQRGDRQRLFVAKMEFPMAER